MSKAQSIHCDKLIKVFLFFLKLWLPTSISFTVLIPSSASSIFSSGNRAVDFLSSFPPKVPGTRLILESLMGVLALDLAGTMGLGDVMFLRALGGF